MAHGRMSTFGTPCLCGIQAHRTNRGNSPEKVEQFPLKGVELTRNSVYVRRAFRYNLDRFGSVLPLTHDMKLNRKALVLAKGQIWKLQDSHIEILEMGKRLASYKHFRTLDNRRAPTQLANIASVEEMLKTHKAVLLDTKAGSAAIKKVTKRK